MVLFLMALAPVVIIASYIYYRDKYEKEPIWLLIKALIAGGLTVIPILFVEEFLMVFIDLFDGILRPAYNAFVVAAFSEELFKYLALMLLFWKSKEFNEKFDGIVYAVFISLGFAAVENILYVTDNGYSTGLIRAITAVPAHAIFGVTMGFYTGLAKFYKKERTQLLIKSLALPILLHGIYDFVLMAGNKWLFIVFVAFVAYLYIIGLKRLKKLSDQSIYRTDYDLLNKKFDPLK